MRYLVYVANFRQNICVAVSLHKLSISTQPVFVTHATCSTTHRILIYTVESILRSLLPPQIDGSDCQSRTSYRRCPGSLVGWSIWNLWWTEWHWAMFSLNVLILPYHYYSTNAPYLTLTLYDLSNCQFREMKHPSKMYKMRLKNLRT